MKKILNILGVWLLGIGLGISQNNTTTQLTLEQCITIALENNLDAKNADLRKETAKINYKQSVNQILPNLNANYNLGANKGRSIDPFTNSYSNREFTYSNLGVNLRLTVFNGFRLLNAIKQDELNLKAVEMEKEETKQNLILDVTVSYIQALNSRDMVKLAKARLKTTGAQLERLETNYVSGSGNPVSYSDIKGQYALDQIAIVNSENSFKSAILDLNRLLNVDFISEKSFEGVINLFEMKSYTLSADRVYSDALQNLAIFKSRTYRIQSNQKGIRALRGSYFPEISVFGQLQTNYSSLAETFTQTVSSVVETGDFVTINNQNFPVFQNKNQFTGNKIDYLDQFDNNRSTVVGLSVRLPLFNGFRVKNNVSLQKIRLEESKIELENTKQRFKQEVQLAHNNMTAAYDRYHLLTTQLEAFKESYRINEVRFKNGVSNIIDYITSKNNMDNAQLNLSRMKYEYLLRVKILEYYRGI
jgi:outer membrane protein